MNRFLHWSAIVIVVAGGCKSAPSRQPVSSQKTLALMPAPGTSSVAKAIQKTQERLAHHETLDDYLSLGQLWVRQARLSNDPGYTMSASACAELGLEIAPGNPRALALKAVVAASQHRFSEAKVLAQSALERDSTDLLALSTLADVDFELGEVSQSIDVVQQMVDFKPGLPSYGRAAHLRWLKGDVLGAKELIRHAIDSGRDLRDPEPWAYSLVQAAGYFWAEGDISGAEAGFQHALSIAPHFPPALVGLGKVAFSRRNTMLAIEFFKEAFELAPLIETAWLLADAYELQGDAEKSLFFRTHIHQHGPQRDRLTLGLYEATRNEHLENALDLLAQEVQARPNVYVWDAWAWALYRAGKFEQAKAAIDHALVHRTPEPRFLFHAGAIALAQAQHEAGIALLEKALVMNPSFDFFGAQEARSLLSQARERSAANARP